MDTSNSFLSHDIKYSHLDLEIQDAVRDLDVYWCPEESYIMETMKKFNILKNIMEHQNNIKSLRVSNVRNYNFRSVLHKIIEVNSCPIPTETTNDDLSVFQQFLLMQIDGNNTVEYITNQAIEYIINNKPNFKANDISRICYEYTKTNLVELSIKQLIIWK